MKLCCSCHISSDLFLKAPTLITSFFKYKLSGSRAGKGLCLTLQKFTGLASWICLGLVTVSKAGKSTEG